MHIPPDDATGLAGAEAWPKGAARRSAASLAAEDMAEGARMMLGISRGLIEAGRRVDLTGLDEEIGRLCAGILALPEAEGRSLRPILVHLREQVEQLHALILEGH